MSAKARAFQRLLCIITLIFMSSCGTLRFSPQGCKTSGYWGSVSEKRAEQEESFSEDYYVLTMDREIRLSDFLKERGVSCSSVKKVRLQLGSAFFIKRKLTVFVTR